MVIYFFVHFVFVIQTLRGSADDLRERFSFHLSHRVVLSEDIS